MKRPFLVTLMAVAAFLLLGANLARAGVGLARWPLLATLPESLPTEVSIGLGVVWGLAWAIEGWGLWILRSWARPAGIALFVLYQIAILSEQALFAQGPYERGLIPGAIVMAILLSGLVAFGLTRPPIRQAFTSAHEEPPLHGGRSEGRETAPNARQES
jgi:hypothetical protein